MTVSLAELYGKEQESEQKSRYERIAAGFAAQFGEGREICFYSAPGRAEIGGNHTDHQHGRVLAAAVNLDIVAAAAKNEDFTLRLKSEEYPGMDVIDLSDLSRKEEEKETSAALLRGVCARVKELGYRIGGFDAFTASRVLKGSGLSSSAAFEVLVVTILSCLFNEGKIGPVETAQIAQYAENVYFGKPSGLLDQMACSAGGFSAIDFADPASPVLKRVNYDLEAAGYVLCVVDTGGSHANLTGDYASIPREMGAIAAALGKKYLREVREEEFFHRLPELRKKAGDRAVLRAMHFFSEDHRAAEEAEMLLRGKVSDFLRLVIESGRSSFMFLQNVYCGSLPEEQGISLALALSERVLSGCGAWRIQGGGFAGTIQAYVPAEKLSLYRDTLENVFGKGSCHRISIRAFGGTKVEM